MSELWYQFRKNKVALAACFLIVALAGIAMFAPFISPYDPFDMSGEDMLTAPSTKHWFGTDQFGRDLLSRIMYGARISFRVGFISVGIALAAGTLIGVVAGFLGGWVDLALSKLIEVLFAFPDIFMALVIMSILGASITNLMIAIGIVYTPIFARIARGAVLEIKSALFIEVARSIGVKRFNIVTRHVLPNILAPLIVQTTLSLAFAILSEAALSFLGLGVEPDTPSWGILLNEGKDWMEMAWWLAVFPGIAITLAVLSFNLMGDGLRDALDPRMRNLNE
jgi:peptide/nickel transport system permease protein